MEIESRGTFNTIRKKIDSKQYVEFCALCALYPSLKTVCFLIILLEGEGGLKYCKSTPSLYLDGGYLSIV